jgi:hypothetical protein
MTGSSIKTKFEMRDKKPVPVRLPELNFNSVTFISKGGMHHEKTNVCSDHSLYCPGSSGGKRRGHGKAQHPGYLGR